MGRGVFVSHERDGGGEREPDVQETERKASEKRWKEMIKQLYVNKRGNEV